MGLALVVVVVPIVAESAEPSTTWERGTVEVGAEMGLPTCHDFSVDEYDGRACTGTVLGKFRGLIRSQGGFLFKPELTLGAAYDTDLVAAHYFDMDEPLKVEEFVLSVALTFGGVVQVANGEVRASGGPRVQVVAATSAARHSAVTAGFELDPHGRISLSGVLDLEIDAEIGDAVRIGPRLRFGVGNELGLLFSSECEQASVWCDDARLIHRDVELEWSVSLGMAFPAASAGAFAIEIGPRFELSAYENVSFEELQARRYDRPRCTLDIAPLLFVGAQLRI